MLAGAAVGVPNYFSSYLLLQALVSLPAFFVYPVFSTGTILVVLLCSALLFKERPVRRQLAGIGVILAALALLNL
jgi:multidrug transporter EmrE-like cation transporter